MMESSSSSVIEIWDCIIFLYSIGKQSPGRFRTPPPTHTMQILLTVYWISFLMVFVHDGFSEHHCADSRHTERTGDAAAAATNASPATSSDSHPTVASVNSHLQVSPQTSVKCLFLRGGLSCLFTSLPQRPDWPSCRFSHLWMTCRDWGFPCQITERWQTHCAPGNMQSFTNGFIPSSRSMPPHSLMVEVYREFSVSEALWIVGPYMHRCVPF